MRHAIEEGLIAPGQLFHLGTRGSITPTSRRIWQPTSSGKCSRWSPCADHRACLGDRSALSCDVEVSELSPGGGEPLLQAAHVNVQGDLHVARRHTLWVSNDNDFLGTIVDAHHPAGMDNPNQFFVFAVDPALLPGFARQGSERGDRTADDERDDRYGGDHED